VAGNRPKRRGDFVNTWSIDGFTGEGCQPAELGWGSHEKALPVDGERHSFGCDAAIYLMRPGAATRVRSWTPLEGPMQAFLITHNESISIADYYTLRDATGAVSYRPTAHYAYHPCDDAVLSLHEFAGRNWELQQEKRLMMEEISTGMDELGVLLMGHKKGAYWYGSRLTIEEARALAPYNNATSLQVCAAVLAGLVFAISLSCVSAADAGGLSTTRCNVVRVTPDQASSASFFTVSLALPMGCWASPLRSWMVPSISICLLPMAFPKPCLTLPAASLAKPFALSFMLLMLLSCS
jgi:homospermidine synthase